MEGQLSLGLDPATTPDTTTQTSVPSAEFAAAHPDAVAPERPDLVIDPNARRAEQLRGAGGGFAAAVAGEMVVAPVVVVAEGDDTPVVTDTPEDEEVYTREQVMAMVQRMRDEGNGLTSQEVAATGRIAARHALNKLGR